MSTPHGGFTSCMFTTVDVKFDGKNYNEWSATVRIIFRALELIEHIDGTSSPTISSSSDSPNAPSATPAKLSTWRAADYRAMALIAQSVEIPIRMKIVDLPTAQEMWNHIRHLYEKKQFHRVQNSNSVINQSMMDSRVISAARSGNIAQLQELYDDNYNLLISSTPYGNNALHLAVIYRQEEFAKKLANKLVEKECLSLLSAANADGNTPLLLAAAAGLVTMVKDLLAPSVGDVEEGKQMLMATNKKQMLMATNKTGNNALHEALRNGHSEVAMELLRAEPELAGQVNNNGVSPLYMACCRRMEGAVEELLRSPTASHVGPAGRTAMHVAAEVGHSGLVKALLEKKPDLAKVQDRNGNSPLHIASWFNKLAVVKLLLGSDASLAYVVDEDGDPPIAYAAVKGSVPIFQEFVRCCPDSALMASKDGKTVLHVAVDYGSADVVEYILRAPELQGLINQPNNAGDVPLHIALRKCNKRTLWTLLACKSLDMAAENSAGETAVDAFFSRKELTTRRASTYLMLKSAFPDHPKLDWWPSVRREWESLFRNYVNNSIVVATLMATVTFAAAFTVPGGYDGNKDAPDEGLPIQARKAAFKAFLISDTIAMCVSLVVAFLCIFAPWLDVEFLYGHVVNTGHLLVCGFAAMSVAFATGLYVVVAPGSLWLAAIICVLCCSLAPVTYLASWWTLNGDSFKFSMPSMRSKITEKIFQIIKKFLSKIFKIMNKFL